MHPAFEIESRPYQLNPAVLSRWIELEASLPNAPFEFFVPDIPGISDDTLEAQFRKSQHEYITSSIHFQQARLAYGQCLAKLMRRKAAKKRQINTQSAVFRLPNEIISYFLQLTGQPILSSQICHRWRAIAIGTPALWCHLSSKIGRVGCPKVNTFLKRTRNHSLFVDHIDLSGVMHLVPRIKALTVCIEHSTDITALCNVSAPLLESVTIQNGVAGGGSLVEQRRVTLFANNAPRLRNVKLDGFALMGFPTQFLTELTLSNCFLPEPSMTIDFLQSIPALQRLTLINNWYDYSVNTSVALDCQLPSLQKLSMSQCYQTGIKIIAPILEHLCLSTPFSGDYPIHHGSSLERLWLQATCFKEAKFWSANAQFQNVRDLHIAAGVVGGVRSLKPVLLALCKRDQTAQFKFLFPSLSRLSIWCRPNKQDLTNIRKLIRLRKELKIVVSVYFIRYQNFDQDLHLMPSLRGLGCVDTHYIPFEESHRL